MNPLFFSKPVLFPRPRSYANDIQRQGVELLCRRIAELLYAAALIDGTEPGLLTNEERDTARRRGAASAKRALADGASGGKPHIAYYRALTGAGFMPAVMTIPKLADRLWVLEDRCGLADSYLRSAADTALQRGAEVILCPSPLRRDRLEAVFFPGARAAFLSGRAAAEVNCAEVRGVHLDRIPEAERRRALRGAMKENRRMMDALVGRAALYLTNAQLLCDMDSDTCVDGMKQI